MIIVLVLNEFQKHPFAIPDFCAICAVETFKLTVGPRQCVRHYLRVEYAALIDTCKVSVPFAIRNTNKLATLVKLYL